MTKEPSPCHCSKCFMLRKINELFIISNMNTIIQKHPPGILRPSELQDWLTAHGLSTVTTEECAHLLGVSANEVPQRLMRLRAKGQLASAARGLWIAVPAEYREMGAPEPIRYIHNLMEFYKCDYCVGWLSAASLHGASHHAPQVFQVAVSKAIRKRSIGRSELQFYFRSYVQEIKKKKMAMSNGFALVCSPGTTMLMVAADTLYCGGIDNVATIIYELADAHNEFMEDVMADARLFPKAAVRRLGWILEHVAEKADLNELSDFCSGSPEPSLLSPGGSRTGRIDKKWNIIENKRIEADI